MSDEKELLFPNGLFEYEHTITPEESERLGRELAKRIQEDHIRVFGGCTVLCWRPKKDNESPA